MRKINSIALTVLLLSVVSMVSAITVSNFSTDKATYAPGDKGILTLNIDFDYPVSSSEELVGFTGVSVELLSPVVSRTVSLGKISPGTLTLTLPIEVDENANEGVYAITVQVYASATVKSGSNLNDKVANTRSVIPLKVVRQPKLTLKISPSELLKQGFAEVELCSENGIAREVVLSSEELYLDGGKVFFSTLEGCASKNVSYDASALESGANTVTFDVSYKDTLGDEHSETLTVPITLSKGETRFLVAQERALPHKRVADLNLLLENRGRAATDIRIKPISGVSFPGISEVFIGSLGPRESKRFSVPAYTELEPGTRTAKLEVTWTEEGKERTETLMLPLTIEDDSPIEVFVEATPTPLIRGEEHTLSVVVANKASYPLSAVSASIESDMLQVLEIQRERFIGSLEGDDFSSQQFKVKVLSSGDGTLNVTVHYRDPSGTNKAVSRVVRITAVEKEEDSTPTIVGIVLLAVGVVVLGRFVDKMRRKKK